MFEIKIKSVSRFLPVLLLLFWALPLSATEPSGENPVMAVAEKMEAAFKEVKDYTCDIEQIFLKTGWRRSGVISHSISRGRKKSGSISLLLIRE
jgi:outer membrane lipoprotein-sorting protein